MPDYQRLLLTGAAGGLGRLLRSRLRGRASVLRLSDIAGLGVAQAGEELVRCDLADKLAVDALVAGCDVIVHMGGVSVERPFEEVLAANIQGCFNLYEGARRHGVRRVLFASSNHVTGFHPVGRVLDAQSPRRPDGYYGLSKSFGEDLARFYFDRYGIETACLRIGSCCPQPTDSRMLATWLSHDDLVALLDCCLDAPVLGHVVVYGVSANRRLWWDNRHAAFLGYQPRDSAEQHGADMSSLPSGEAGEAQRFQGGAFVTVGPFDGADA